jgi:hypothetical protein
MRDRENLRKGDIVAGILLICMGIAAIFGASQMPIQASYGGVDNRWYVSPALFPFIISFFIVVLGVISLGNAIRELGREKLKEMARILVQRLSTREKLEPKVFRIIGVMLLLLFYVYLFIPRVDFFLSSFLMLTTFITAYYYDVDALTRKLMRFYLFGALGFTLYFLVGLGNIVNGLFVHGTDVLALLFIIVFIIYSRVLAGGDAGLKRRFRISLTTGLLVPLLLCPIFKYALLIPLPEEGGIIRLMDYIRYTLF